jgi:hypothetical protein
MMIRAMAIAFLILLLQLTAPCRAEDPLGRDWPADERLPLEQIDHTRLDELLNRYVDPEGLVDYSGWHESNPDRQKLRDYLTHLSRAKPEAVSSRESRLAYWINAYNAVTIEGILRVYPTDSIRNHTARVIGYNIWTDLPLRVAGRDYSLDDIEHRVLRKLGEPRIHFALVCASKGCPRLRNEAWKSDELESQFTDNARHFFAQPSNLSVSGDGTIVLSPLLDWYGEDFGADQAVRMKALTPYIPDAVRPAWSQPAPRITFNDYDWSLNDQQRKSRAP